MIYRSGLNDSSRWAGFVFRPGDIVISTPSKCGTTWMQMICALLIFQTAELPAPLTTLSPWLDMRLRPLDEVVGRLEAQRHRRFIKTHTPLDGLPQADGVHYITVGRDPRDVAVSMMNHRTNLNGEVIDALMPSPTPQSPQRPPTGLRDRVVQWIRDDRPPATSLDSLRTVVWHLAGAWSRRREPTVTVLHYNDLSDDLEWHMRYLSATLDITVAERLWPGLVRAASFEQMKARAPELVPDERLGILTDDQAFFHSGQANQWRQVLTVDDVAEYETRLHSLTTPEIAAWLTYGERAG